MVKLETLPDQFQALKPLEGAALAYVAGYVLKVKTKLTNCVACKYNVLKRLNETDDFNCLIKYKEYGGKTVHRLKYCNFEFLQNLTRCYNITKYIISNKCGQKNMLKYVLNTISENVRFNFIECVHSVTLETTVIESFIKLVIYNYFNGINNVISGKDGRDLENCTLLRKQAKEIFDKRRKYLSARNDNVIKVL